MQQGEAYDFTAAPLHRFPAYDAIHGPVPAFDQHVWLYGLDELRGRILVEPDHEIHAFQMRQHKGPHPRGRHAAELPRHYAQKSYRILRDHPGVDQLRQQHTEAALPAHHG